MKCLNGDIVHQSQSNSNKKGMTKTFLNVYTSIETIVNGFVSLVVNVFMFAITTLTPLAAPIAPAFSVFKALSERLQTPFAIALAGAIAIEITGMFVAKTSIGCHNWNSARNKTDPEAPKGLAITMASIFFSVIFVLSLTIELNPNLVVWIYPGFVVVAITVYVSLAISNNLKEWEAQKAKDLELRELKNGLNAEVREAQKRLALLTRNLADTDSKIDAKQSKLDALIAQIEAAKSVQPSVKQSVQPSVQDLTLNDVKNAVSASEKPINITQLAKNLHISRTTLYSKLNSLVDSGEMVKNGNGYELNGSVKK